MGSDETLRAVSGAEQDKEGRPVARRHRSALVAAVATAVLLAGGGGAVLAANASDQEARPPASGRPEPLALDGYALSGKRGVAPGEPDPTGPGPFRINGSLPEGPRHAKVYLAKGQVSRDAVARLAKALRLDGVPKLDGGVWRVGGGAHSTGPSLQVSRKAPGDWTFSRRGWTVACPDMPGGPGSSPSAPRCTPPHVPADTPVGSPGSPAAAGWGSADAPVENPPAGLEGDPVPKEKAEREAGPVLEAVGLGDEEPDASLTTGGLRTVSAEPRLEGRPTLGWTTSVEIGRDGPVAGHGRLSEPTAGEEYPVVSAKHALAMLGGGPKAHYRQDVAPCVPGQPKGPKASAKPVLPADPERYRPDTGGPRDPGQGSGGPRNKPRIMPCVPPVQPEPQEVRKAAFGYSAQSVRGTSALVPSWLFTVAPAGSDDTRVIAQVAVDPRHIRGEVPPPQPGGDGRESAPAEHPAVESYRVEGRTLTVYFWGGVCTDYSAAADETGKQVTVQVTGKARHPGRPCIMIAKRFGEKVMLDRPLGDRKVVDAASGERVRGE